MLASYATVVRRAAVPTAVGAAVIVALSAVLVGMKGLVGALLGVAIVSVFFGLSIAVVGRAARAGQAAMMVAALSTFLVKIVALAVVVSMLNGATAFSTRTLGFTAIACILLWSTAQVVTAMRVRLLYVEPAEPAKPAERAEPAEPAKPAKRAERAEPAKQDEPAKLAKQDEPAMHAEQAGPVKQAEPQPQGKQ